MRVKAPQLGGYLQQHGLSAVYCLLGTEPLQQQEAADQIRSLAHQQGYKERQVLTVDARFNWQDLQAEAANLSLFSQLRLLELRLADKKPGKEGAKALNAYFKNLPADTLLLISMNKQTMATQKTAWFQLLEKNSLVVVIQDINSQQLPNWLRNRANSQGLQLTQGALNLIAERAEGHLLAASQELEKLKLLYPEKQINEAEVLEAVADSAKFEVFSWIETILAGDVKRLHRQWQGLKDEGAEAIILIALLHKELRLLSELAYLQAHGGIPNNWFKQHGIWQSRQQIMQKAARRHQVANWQVFLQDVIVLEHIYKGEIQGDTWDSLLRLAMGIAGLKVF